MPEPMMSEEERDDLIDRLPVDMPLWPDEEELARGHFTDRDWAWWRDTLGHPYATGHGFCRTCGPATPCLLGVFYDSVISSVIRELARLGALRKPGPAEHCVHDAGIHHRHHHTRVDGCPWCSETGTADDVPTGGLT